MILKSIKLKNIGPFKGVNEILLDSNKDRNIILIGGKNGSGKTTILNSLKIGLFGSHSLGLVTQTKKYFETIRELLNNECLRNNIINYFIEIKYEEITNLESREIVLMRKWEVINSNITEQLNITVDGDNYNDEDALFYINNLKAKIHPTLISSLMFDGEKIASLIDDGMISSYISSILSNAFNISLFENMSSDLSNYITKEVENSNLTQDEIIVMEKRSELKRIEEQIKSLNKEISEWDANLQDLELIMENDLQNYSALGGLNELNAKEFRDKVYGLERKRNEKKMNLNYFLENLYPFYINIELMTKTRNHLIKDFPIKILSEIKYLREIAVENDLNIDEIIGQFSISSSNITEENIHNSDQVTIQAFDRLLKLFKTDYKAKKIKDIQSAINRENTNIRTYKDKISKAEMEELNNLYKNIVNKNNMIINAKEKLNIKFVELTSLKEAFESSSKDLQDYEKEVFSKTKERNSFEIANKLMDINTKFIKIKKQKIIYQLEKLVTIKFKSVIRKKDYIDNIEIDKSNYNILLKRSNGDKFSINNLSAGEKQILIASLITSIYDLSRKAFPFIFDTPLARLDRENRKNFIEKIIKNSSSQVIVLSTDEEIDEELVSVINKNINRKYLLENDGSPITKIYKNAYFGDELNA